VKVRVDGADRGRWRRTTGDRGRETWEERTTGDRGQGTGDRGRRTGDAVTIFLMILILNSIEVTNGQRARKAISATSKNGRTHGTGVPRRGSRGNPGRADGARRCDPAVAGPGCMKSGGHCTKRVGCNSQNLC
jgi:hypothetical protein